MYLTETLACDEADIAEFDDLAEEASVSAEAALLARRRAEAICARIIAAE